MLDSTHVIEKKLSKLVSSTNSQLFSKKINSKSYIFK